MVLEKVLVLKCLVYITGTEDICHAVFVGLTVFDKFLTRWTYCWYLCQVYTQCTTSLYDRLQPWECCRCRTKAF